MGIGVPLLGARKIVLNFSPRLPAWNYFKTASQPSPCKVTPMRNKQRLSNGLLTIVVPLKSDFSHGGYLTWG